MISRRIFAAFALLCVFAAPAYAQKTKAALTSEINTNWPDNVVGAITPATLRLTVLDIVNSYYDLNGGTSLTCAAHQWVAALPTLSSITCTQPAFSDLSGSIAPSQIPPPTATTLGGVESYATVSHQWINTISTAGAPGSSQPAIADVSGWGTNVAVALGNTLNASGGLVGFSGNIGTASGTSLALGGASIGSNALAITGPFAFSAGGSFGGALTGITTLSMSGQLTSTLTTGTAPFSVASQTIVPNLNASFLNGGTFASPGPIGSGTPGSAAHTTLSVTSGGSLAGTFTGTPTFSGANFLSLANLPQSTSGAQLLGVTGASAANYAPFTIQGLTNAAPNPTLDYFLFYNHTTGTLEAATPSQISSAVGSGVTSLNSLTGALSIVQGAGITVTPSGSNVTVKQSLSNVTLQATFGSPTGTTSTTGAMMGAGATCTITPAYSSRVHLNFRGSMYNATTGDIVAVSAFYGTGTAPTNGQAQSGSSCGSAACTQIGATQDLTSSSGGSLAPFNVGGNITGLTPGTAYWFDMALSVSAGTGHIQGSACDGFEY